MGVDTFGSASVARSLSILFHDDKSVTVRGISAALRGLWVLRLQHEDGGELVLVLELYCRSRFLRVTRNATDVLGSLKFLRKVRRPLLYTLIA